MIGGWIQQEQPYESEITSGTTTRSGGLQQVASSVQNVDFKNQTLTTGLRRETVQGVVALAHSPDRTAKREGGGGGECPAVRVDVNNADLDGGVVLGGDEAV